VGARGEGVRRQGSLCGLAGCRGRRVAQANLAEVTSPGQCYQLRCPVTDTLQPFLLWPMSVYGVGPQPGVVEFLRGAPVDEVHCVFDSDGSSAVPAVELRVREWLAGGRHDVVYPCGSQRLLQMLQRVLADHPEVHGEVALEQRMACGMGVCLSCVRLFEVDGERQFLRVCRDGPVFPIRTVVGEVEFG